MVALELNFIKMHNMKYLLLLFATIISLYASAQKNNILKQKKIPIYRTMQSLVNVNHTPKPAIIEGIILQVNNKWGVCLSDGTQIPLGPEHAIYVQHKFDLNKLLQKKVRIKGDLYVGATAIADEGGSAEKETWGYKIDVKEIKLAP